MDDAAVAAAVAGVRRGSGTVSVVLRVSGEEQPRCSIEPEAQHYAASTMKLPVLVAAQRLAERGELDLDRTVVVHDDFDSLVPGRRFTMDPAEDSDPETWAAVGNAVPLRELVERMVTVSGNLATDLVLEQVGPAEVATVLELAGCSPRTVLPRGIEDYPARDAGLDNLVTADDLARVMVALADGRLTGSAAGAECERILRAQTYRAGIPAGLPEGLEVGNKTGWIDGVNHDVALVRAPGLPPTGLAVLVSAPGTPEEREAGIARLTSAVWDLTMSR
jgi:beta-lactamase class A